jgi:hypothetical protein
VGQRPQNRLRVQQRHLLLRDTVIYRYNFYVVYYYNVYVIYYYYVCVVCYYRAMSEQLPQLLRHQLLLHWIPGPRQLLLHNYYYTGPRPSLPNPNTRLIMRRFCASARFYRDTGSGQ